MVFLASLALLVVVGLDGSAVRALLLGFVLATLAGLATIARYGASARRRSLKSAGVRSGMTRPSKYPETAPPMCA